MSLFLISPPNTAAPTDAWRVRVEVDPCDWDESDTSDRLGLMAELHRRYVDSDGNSAYDLVEVWAGDRLVRSLELHDPPRRTGPLGGDRNVPSYTNGRRKR